MRGEQGSEESADETPAPEHALLPWVLGLAGFCVAGLFALGVRQGLPVESRASVDIVIQVLAGLLMVGVSLRALISHRIHLADMLVLVVILSQGLKFAVDARNTFVHVGLLPSVGTKPSEAGGLVLGASMVASVLLGGASLGFWYCQCLRITAVGWRMLYVAAGTLVLPSCAGAVVFPTLVIRDTVTGNTLERTALYAALWIGSTVVAAINTSAIMRCLVVSAMIAENRLTNDKKP